MFGGLGLKGQPNESLVRTDYEGSFTEEVTEKGKAVFEGVFNFAASEVRKNFDSTYSAVQID